MRLPRPSAWAGSSPCSFFLEKRGQGAGGMKFLRDLSLITIFSAAGAGLIVGARVFVGPVIAGYVSGVFLQSLIACVVLGLPAWLMVLWAIHIAGVQDVPGVFKLRRRTAG